MPTLQDLNGPQIDEAVQSAVERCVPVAASVRSGAGWLNLRTRFVATRGDRVLVELPGAGEGHGPWEFTPADKLGMSFKLKHHKHLCTATVAGIEQYAIGDGETIPVLSLCWPVRMQRLQRRAYMRADVPNGHIVRASFWLGGRGAEPSGTSTSAPVWSGTVSNLSAGGLQLHCDDDLAGVLEAGDVVGVRILFGVGEEAVYSDAQFRHIERNAGGYLLGFQFVGLEQTREGHQALRLISNKVSEYQHAFERTSRR